MRSILPLGLVGSVFCLVSSLQSAPNFLDVRTVMKLAGAHNDEIELARVRHIQTIAESKQTWQKFWPSVNLEMGYRNYNGSIQEVGGAVFDAKKEQYTIGSAVVVDWSPGELYYAGLAAIQRVHVSGQLAEKARRDLVLQAVEIYYDLLAQEAAMSLVEDDIRELVGYSQQLAGAVEAGTGLRSDLLRVRTQVSRTRLHGRQLEEQRDILAAALAEILRLSPDTVLRPAKSDLVAVRLLPDIETKTMLASAGTQRPEILAADAATEAARIEEKGAQVSPLLPSVQARYGAGGLGGGQDDAPENFGDEQDVFIGLGWKIGPGGLFDKQRRKIAETKAEAARLQTEEVKAVVGREVVVARARVASAGDQIAYSDEAVALARELVQITRERQTSEIGVVLDYILALEELRGALLARLKAVALYNKAQHSLLHAVGYSEDPEAK
jgi:outer membrane protein TolC